MSIVPVRFSRVPFSLANGPGIMALVIRCHNRRRYYRRVNNDITDRRFAYIHTHTRTCRLNIELFFTMGEPLHVNVSKGLVRGEDAIRD